MMIPASAGWEPEAAATQGVLPDEPLVVVNDVAGLLLPLLGVGALIAAAYMMENARAAVEDDDDVVDVEIDEDDDDFDDDDDEEFDEDDDEDEIE